MKIVCYILLLLLSVSSYGQFPDKCLKMYKGYAYTVSFNDCPPHRSCSQDFFFSYNQQKFSDTIDFNRLADSFIVLNVPFYEGYYMLNFFGAGNLKDFLSFKGNVTKHLEYSVKECEVVIFGYTSHESIKSYAKQKITAHRHSIYSEIYDGKEKIVDVLYPAAILE